MYYVHNKSAMRGSGSTSNLKSKISLKQNKTKNYARAFYKRHKYYNKRKQWKMIISHYRLFSLYSLLLCTVHTYSALSSSVWCWRSQWYQWDHLKNIRKHIIAYFVPSLLFCVFSTVSFCRDGGFYPAFSAHPVPRTHTDHFASKWLLILSIFFLYFFIIHEEKMCNDYFMV